MTHVAITINGVTALNADLHQGQTQPPPELERLLKPGTNEPWMRAILAPLADALLTGWATTITISGDPTQWAMNVAVARP